MIERKFVFQITGTIKDGNIETRSTVELQAERREVVAFLTKVLSEVSENMNDALEIKTIAHANAVQNMN